MTEYTQSPVEGSVRRWLFVGIVMIFFQILLGGITRLTGSGLSITKWDIVTGTVPPLSEESWQKEFDLYKQTPQYHKINKGMDLRAFKHIYFWEYVHRLWARTMGFVFLIPFLIFLRKRKLPGWLRKDLIRLVILAAFVASFGWIMVASGLVNRPWVNAYKLMLHLGLGILLFEYMVVIYLKARGLRVQGALPFGKTGGLVALIGLQVLMGGLMSGMKAGFAYPTFPKMAGEWIPHVLTEVSNWRWEHLKDYDGGSMFAPALVQLIHRTLAYIIGIVVLLAGIRIWRKPAGRAFRKVVNVLVALTGVQIGLGIYTVLGCSTGSVPLVAGVLHQATGILTLTTAVVLWFYSKARKIPSKF